jgi:sugar phosphate isomerase/epimerase
MPVISLAPTLGPLVGAQAPTPRQVIEQLASMNFRHVQLSATLPGMRPRELDASARRDVLAVLRRFQLVPAGVDLWIATVDFMDPARADRAMTAVREAIALAGDLGRLMLSLTLPSDPAATEAIINWAQRAGVPLADHSIPPLARDGAGVGIDPAAWLSQGKDPVAGVLEHGPRLASARLCDLSATGIRGPIAAGGRLDVAGYQVSLAAAGYRSPLVIDARQWTDSWHGVRTCAEDWQNLARMLH